MTVEILSNPRRGKRHPVFISDEDNDLSQYAWTVVPNGGWYPYNNKLGTLHKIILERILGRPLRKGEETDHINRNRLDARRENLRLSTRSQNGCNREIQENNQSGMRGVHWDKRHRLWVSQIKVNGNNIRLGNYDTREEAGIVYNHAALENFGEFAQFNNIPDWREIFPVRKLLGYPRTNSRNKSGYRGVCRTPNKKRWQAQITKDNMDYNLGVFDDKHDAARVWNAKARELYGANAYQNEVME